MFGGMFVTESGNAWYTPESIPLRLIQKETIRSSISNQQARAFGEINFNKSYPFMIFFCGRSDAEKQVVATITPTASGVSYYGFSYDGNNTANFYLDVYLFSCQPKQSPGGYGLEIYNKYGDLILTNHDKVLTDIEKNDYQQKSKPGKWGFTPGLSGGRLYRVGGGGPGGFLIQVPFAFSCTYNGYNTTLSSSNTIAPPGGVPESGFNLGNENSIINLEMYD